MEKKLLQIVRLIQMGIVRETKFAHYISLILEQFGTENRRSWYIRKKNNINIKLDNLLGLDVEYFLLRKCLVVRKFLGFIYLKYIYKYIYTVL